MSLIYIWADYDITLEIGFVSNLNTVTWLILEYLLGQFRLSLFKNILCVMLKFKKYNSIFEFLPFKGILRYCLIKSVKSSQIQLNHWIAHLKGSNKLLTFIQKLIENVQFLLIYRYLKIKILKFITSKKDLCKSSRSGNYVS